MKEKTKNLVIFGAGSSGKEISLLVDEINQKSKKWQLIAFIDSNKKLIGKKIRGVEVFKDISNFKNKKIYWVCSVMNPNTKKEICDKISIKFKATNLIHPSTNLPKDVKIGKGNVIFSNIHLSYELKIGNYNMISFGCDIGHNTKIRDYNSIMPGVIINGHSSINNLCQIGSGAIINNKISIGNKSIVGSGTFIFQNIGNETSVFNLPRQIKKKIK